MRLLKFSFILILAVLFSTEMHAQQTTRVVVRAIAADAKFIGDGVGSTMITILDTATGDTLAHGLTKGGSGDTQRLMVEPRERYDTLSTPDAAAFEARLALQKPTQVTIKATGPYGEPHARVTTSTQKWIIPGRDITGDGVILEIPGFAVTNQLPSSDSTHTAGRPMSLRTHIVMMCGCPTEDGGLWDSSEYEIRAQIRKDGDTIAEVPLTFTGETNWFEGTFTPEGGGSYTAWIYAYHPATGNTGVDKTDFRVMGSN